MKRLKMLFEYKLIIMILCILILFFVLISQTMAYFGLTSLSALGLYGGLLPYSFGTPYSFTTMGLYGVGGLYGGLYGLNGLYGMGGMFGLTSMYNNPFCCTGSFGLSSTFGLNNIWPNTYGYGNTLTSLSQFPAVSTFNPFMSSLMQMPNMVTAEQAGNWSGTWTSLVTLKGGIMNMSIVEDPLTGVLSGTVNLLLNKVTNSIPADVVGYISTLGPGALGITGTGGAITTFILSGSNQNFFGTTTLLLLPSLPSVITVYTIDLVCVMTTPVTIAGTYDVADIYKLNVDSGEFSLTLTSPII